MAIRNIIKIDEEKCNGCGQCVTSCAEGAIQIIDGKAKLVSETYCDGLGACLGSCPMDAIRIEERESLPFDEAAVEEHLAKTGKKPEKPDIGFTCPGMMMKEMKKPEPNPDDRGKTGSVQSQLGHWPVQMKLLSPNAPYLKNADLLFAADCVPFAMGDFHSRFLKDKVVAIGCPKLDGATEEYIDKLSEMIAVNDIKSLTVVHMEVPCCSGMTMIARKAAAMVKTDVTVKDVTISLNGEVKETVEYK